MYVCVCESIDTKMKARSKIKFTKLNLTHFTPSAYYISAHI